MGPPRSKRPRCGFGSADGLGMRRAQSVPRSLADMMQVQAAGGPSEKF
jgi:hypothetical protein